MRRERVKKERERGERIGGPSSLTNTKLIIVTHKRIITPSNVIISLQVLN